MTIDLDYFAGLSAGEQATGFAHIWNFVIELPNLRAITFAISRPYLKDEDEAYRLLNLVLAAALSLPTAQIEFEPFLRVANDHSNLAKELIARGEKLPVFDLSQAPQELRARILSDHQRIVVRYDATRWQELLHIWNDEAPKLHLQVKGRQCSTDNVWRIPADEQTEIELTTEPWTTKPEKIEWFALTPKYLRCNLTALSIDQVGFVANAASRPAWTELPIGHHNSVLPITKIDNLFDPEWHCGSLRLRARAIVDGKIRETPVLELRRVIGTGFRAAVTEQFGLPYLFGSGELSENSNTGPETNLGADCANFVVYALRRQGQRVPWSDPRRLRDHLDLVARAAAPGTAKISAEDLDRGAIVHLGTHVAAIMEDREPVGILDQNDLVAHQLGGIPEILTLGKLLQDRRKNCFDLFRVPPEKPEATLVFGGDVMLGRSCAAKIENGTDPFTGLQPFYAAQRSPPQTWNARSRTSATPHDVTHSAPPRAPRNCSIGPDFAQWDWQIITRSISGPKPWMTAQTVCSANKSRQSELENATLTPGARVSFPCPMGKNSLFWQSTTLGLLQALKSPWHRIVLASMPQSLVRAHTQISWSAWFIGELRTVRTSPMNSANWPAG